MYSPYWLVGNLGRELCRKFALVNVTPFPCSTHFPINVLFVTQLHISRQSRSESCKRDHHYFRTLYSAVKYRNWIRRCGFIHKKGFVPKLETYSSSNIMILVSVYVTYIRGVRNMKQFTSRLIINLWPSRQYCAKN